VRSAAALLGLACLFAADVVGAANPPLPSPERIRECIEEFDTGGRYVFRWKELTIGEPRHPQNNFEALAPLGGEGRRAEFGYPVHGVFNLGGFADIDAMYWLIADADGSWVIPAICRIAPGG
jgi:hypothetical protein